MLSTITTNTSSVATYDRSGRTLSLLRSESAQRIAIPTEQGSTTGENYKDKVTLSESGVEKSRQAEGADNESSNPTSATSSDQQETAETQAKTNTQGLTPPEEKVVQELKIRDREVKTHEMAHLANAGQYARGGPTYSYQQGPDGQRYAIGGEVPIDISQEKTPEQTIQKMQAVRRAAMAPAEPSSADRSIAAAATAAESQARQEVQSAQAATSQTQKETEGESDDLATGEKQPGMDAPASDSAPRTQPLNIIA